MQNVSGHEFGMCQPELFHSLLVHEMNKSRRYGDSLTLVEMLIETDPAHPETRSDAERFVIDMLQHYLRETDISCKRDNEVTILMPSTSAPGARTACERVSRGFLPENGAPASLTIFIGMASLPTDHSISSEEFAQNALRALQYARTNGLKTVVAFSEVKKE